MAILAVASQDSRRGVSLNQLATRVTLPFLGGSESGLVRLGSGEGLGTSLDEAMARQHLGVCISMLADHYTNHPISNRRRFRPQSLGWRSTSLGLGELTPGYCGNAFGVKKDDFVCSNANFRFENYYRR